MELAEAAVKRDAEEYGFIMVCGQSIKEEDGSIRKLAMRCKCYRQPAEQHDLTIHPSDHWEGTSFRTACLAHVNIRSMSGSSSYYLSLVDAKHNQPRTLPIGGHAQSRSTEQQQQFIAKYAEHGGFSWQHLIHMLAMSATNSNHASTSRKWACFWSKHKSEQRIEHAYMIFVCHPQ